MTSWRRASCCAPMPPTSKPWPRPSSAYCPACRGVWLDRGELDKLIERSAGAAAAAAPQPAVMTMPAPPRQKDWDDDDYKRGYPHKKKKSLLGELFDF